MVLDEEKSFEVLREIFLSDSNKKLEDLEKEFKDFKFLINDTEYQISTLYPIIDKIIDRKIIHSKSELTQSISPILGPAIKNQIAESKDEIIDALFPIIGEIIKKAVAEKVKEVYQSLNAKIEATLQKGIFSKFIKSKISGVSANDLILQEAFPFSLKEIFLIHEKSGILISHISASENNKTLDADLISGMLTAIKNFVSESFANESGNQNLYEIQYGESKIILERGRYSYLAAVVSGQEPINFRDNLTDTNNDIHKSFHKKLREFNGEIDKLENINQPLKNLLDEVRKNEVKEIQKKEKPLLLYAVGIFIGIVLLIAALFTLPKYFRERSISDTVKEKFELLTNEQLKNVNWEIDDDEIILNGTISSYNVKEKIDSILGTIHELKNIKSNLGVLLPIVDENVIAENIRKYLMKNNSKENSQIKFTINKDKVTIWGRVNSNDEKTLFGSNISEIPGVRILINNLVVNQISDLEADMILNNLKLNFDLNQTEITLDHKSNINQLIPFLKRNENLKLDIIGYSDFSGDKIVNKLKTEKRINNLVDYLASVGIDKNKLNVKFAEDGKNERRIEFKLNVTRGI